LSKVDENDNSVKEYINFVANLLDEGYDMQTRKNIQECVKRPFIYK
jgi:hypothetical protein